MSETLASLQSMPLIPLPWLLTLAGLALAALALAVWRRAPGGGGRAVALLALLAALAAPHLISRKSRPLPDVALVVVDDSPSQGVGERREQTARALADLRERLDRLPNLEVRVRHEAGSADGTPLFQAAEAALADIPRRRLAGIVMITDGRVHDVPADGGVGLGAPLHVLLTGRPDERDRRVVIGRAPGFALVGRAAPLSFRVEDAGRSGAAAVTVRLDGGESRRISVPLNRDVVIDVPVGHAGTNVVEVQTDLPEGDLVAANNRAVVGIAAVRDRLKVLLISGEPHAGERVWRNLLKSDPSVDLVHFTILRPPEKDDRTPIQELALITFPVRELFEDKLKGFDLVIFDRYRHRGIMSERYYRLLADYVRGGGALLVAVGPEYAESNSIAESALGEVLPAVASGRLLEGPFVPARTELGRRHPVTADLPAAPAWGPWLRQVAATPLHGQTLLTGLDGRPVLILDQIGRGRVAQVLSDTIWLWARGYQGGGPHDELLRRLAHWLMQEPELEADSLTAEISGDQLRVGRRSLAATVEDARVTAPDGQVSVLPLRDQQDGRWLGSLPAPQPGLWRVQAGGHDAVAIQGTVSSVEMAEVTATAAPLRPVTERTGGSIRFLATDGLPEARKVAAGATAAGQRWLGLVERGDHVVEGLRQIPLLPAVLILLLALGGALLAWRRESR